MLKHYSVYVVQCKEAGIKETEQATLRKVWAAKIAKEKEKEQKKVAGPQLQLTLNSMVKKVEMPTTFSQTAILDAVTQHVVCSDQVCDVPSFSHGSLAGLTVHSLYGPHLNSLGSPCCG